MKERITAFDYNSIKDPLVFEQNRLPAHAELQVYCRGISAAEGIPLEGTDASDSSDGQSASVFISNRFLSLDGEWKFSYSENYSSAIPGFEAADYDCHEWADIQVPGHIQLQGYDIPHYTNTAYPWDGREDVALGEVPERFNPVAEYVKYFELPSGYLGREIRIVFEGVESGAAIWLNGNYVGYMENSFDPAEFDLTEFLQAGENKLAVQVFKWTSGSWCEDQDFFRFSGIYRSVYLYVVPELHLEDLTVRTLLDDDCRNAALSLFMRIKQNGDEVLDADGEADNVGYSDGVDGEAAKAKVKISLYEEGIMTEKTTEGSDAAVTEGAPLFLSEERALKSKNQFEFPLRAPLLWSAEKPNLYRLCLELQDSSGEIVERTELFIGFRKFEIKDRLMCLNGKRIVFKGVNRHEFSSKTGRTVSKEEVLQDIITMKQNNINAIRTSHYPDNVWIYDLCDRYGLYLMAENNMETHGTWNKPGVKEHPELVIPGDDTRWEPMLLDRVDSCYGRDKNHPSILIWSCGNESYGGTVIKHMAERFRKLDPYRPVHYEGIFQDRRYPSTSDIESQMYTPVDKIQEFLQQDRSKPFICCEYSHAMGNSCGAMHKYTDLTDTEPAYQGGFIWDYIDQSLDAHDRYGQPYQAYGGDFGDRPTNYNFSGNGIVYGDDRTPSPKMQEVKYNYQNISVSMDGKNIHVVNKHLFTNTREYRCIASLYLEGVLQQSIEIATEVPALSEHDYPMPEWERQESGEYCVIVSFQMKQDTLWCQAGHEIAFGQYVYVIPKETETIMERISRFNPFKKKAEKVSEPLFEVIQGVQNIGVRGEHFELLFSKGAGGLVSYRYEGREYISLMPRPNFWRAPVDNDYGSHMEMRYAQWKLASLYMVRESEKKGGLEVKEKKNAVTVSFRYRMATRPESHCKISYTVLPTGAVEITLQYEPVKKLGDMPEFGMLFTLDAALNQVEWYGLGPEETYADRKRGAKLGIYRNQVQDNMARYLVPQECGNKEEVRYIKVTDESGTGLLVTGENLSVSALPYTPHELEYARHAYELPPIHHTILRVTKGQMGVGGDDSWGARVHPEYLLDLSEPLTLRFVIQGISGGKA